MDITTVGNSKLPGKSGFGALLTGISKFEMKHIAGSLSVKSRPACICGTLPASIEKN